MDSTTASIGHRRVPGPLLRLGEAEHGGAERPALEAFVQQAFERRHGASIATFMPTLLSFHDDGGRLRGVIGVRGAAPRELYLEQYLEHPIEAAITAVTGRPVRREEVVEVGNLAGDSCRTAMRMVAVLPAYLLARNYRWIAFTATRAVRGILAGFRAPLVELARADGGCVSEQADRWGRYYENDPRVLVGYLPDSRRIPGFRGATRDR